MKTVTVLREPDDLAESGPTTRGDSFESFVLHRSPALLRTSLLLTRDAQLAEDLLQTALAKAWSRWSRIDRSHEAYVRKILVNTYSTWWRRTWNGESPTDRPPEVVHHDSDAAAGDDLREALARLPRRQRAVVVLRFFEDLSELETAEAMDCTIGTVKSQASKALAKLRVDPALHQDSEGGRR
ncbi:MAG: SigE family RNA polymerase sigma factor [Nocardioidaceae bacterium]